MRWRHPGLAGLALGLMTALPALANETKEKTAAPGFRPASEQAEVFLAEGREAAIEVFPSIVRTKDGVSHSAASQKQVLAMLKEAGFTKVALSVDPLDPGKLESAAQFDMFQHDLRALEKIVAKRGKRSGHALVMEFLFPPFEDRWEVFGIHCYLIDAEGRNAFSFLMNSHHQAFVDAKLVGEKTGEGRGEVMEKATKVGVLALVVQVEGGSAAVPSKK